MHRPTLASLTGLVAVGLLAAGAVTASPTSGREGARHPHHPASARFTHGRVDNPWFPLKPGTTPPPPPKSLRNVRAGPRQGGHNGRLGERTRDFYAQTRRGTVWYFGERTATLDRHGHVISREGSFLSGVDGAEAGVFMTPHPRPGPAFFQEFYPGHAMDVFTVVRRGAHVSVPLVSSDHALLTRETTPLEPGVVDHKYYVRDIGTVREVTVKGGHERLHLVGIRHLPRR